MRKMQKLGYMAIGAVFTLVLAMALPVFAASTQRQLTAHFNNIRVVVDGVLITPRDGLGNVVEPFVVDGTTYLPVRAVAEALGRQVEWDGATQTVYIGVRPGAVQFLPDVAPAFQTSSQAVSIYTEFSTLQSGGAERFSLGGVTFTEGIIMSGNAWGVHNLNGQFTSFSGVVSQRDGEANPFAETPSVRIFTDGRLALEVLIEAGMLPQEFTIDITGVNQLRIENYLGFGGVQLHTGIGNPVIR